MWEKGKVRVSVQVLQKRTDPHHPPPTATLYWAVIPFEPDVSLKTEMMSQKRIPQPPNPLLLQADITVLMAKAAPFSEQSPTGPWTIPHLFLSPSRALEAEWPCSHSRTWHYDPTTQVTYIAHCPSARQWPLPGRLTLAFCPDFLSTFPSRLG